MRLKAAGLCGIIGPLTTSAFTLTAILYAPWFSWTDNALSDLGVQGAAAALFNTGLIAGGLITAVFTVGLGEALKGSTSGRVGASILTLDAFTLTSIGVFPETAGPIHLYVSVLFFTLLPIALLTIGASMIRRASERRLGFLAASMGVVAATVWIPSYRGVAVPEAVAYLSAALWFIVMDLKLYSQGSIR